MLSTTRTFDGPCKGIAACYVTAMEATIRYPDGKEANVDTGAWLHHIALSSTRLQPIWACGNERPTLRLNSNGKYGFEFPDTFGMMIDLMVEGPTAKTLTLELSYEYVLKTNPDYKPAAVHWLTLGMDRAAQAGSYSFDTQSSAVAAQSKLLYAIG
jgi:hypothetical protein